MISSGNTFPCVFPKSSLCSSHRSDNFFPLYAPSAIVQVPFGCAAIPQQNSDITYRVYDYDRLSNGKPRQLHIQQSLDVIKVPAAPLAECMIKTGEAEANKLQKLIECKYYQVFHMKVEGQAEFEQEYPFLIVSVVEGNGLLNHTSVKKGDHFILPYGYGKVEMEGNLEFVASTVSTK